jgi:SAM-dependent methyltransferase
MDDAQMKLWNTTAGQAWVDLHEVLDRMYEPFAQRLVAAASTRGARRVLDIGCGTGGTTLALARQLGAAVSCTGIDISEPMLALAESRAERERLPATFIRGDAQCHAFEPAAFDLLVSRFGVMFFDDPVQAFRNLRAATEPRGALCAITWRSAADNPFMTTAERAAAPLLANPPARPADGPGQFAFADPERVRSVLERSGWSEIALQPLDVACALPVRELDSHISRLGPLGRILPDLEEPQRTRLVETVRAAFAPYVHGSEVRYDAACWTVSARA